jgi:epsilon-lactone hydrolase
VADVASEAGEGGVSIMGDSAGGGLALAVAQQFGRSASTALRRLILIAPWLDITLDEAAWDADVPRDAMLDRPGLREAGRLYRGELSETDPRVSPLNGDLSQLPPISLFTGT